MKKLLLTLLILGICATSFAYRTSKPVPIYEINENTLVELNSTLEELWDLTNGRYSLDLVTVNPDGATRGDIGDMLLLNDSGTYYLEINVDGGTTWRGVQLTNTP